MAWPDERCAACPRTALGLAGPCLAQTRRIQNLCGQQAKGDTRYTALLTDAVSLTGSAVPPARPRYEPVRGAMREWINLCLYRECRTGCERTRCHAGRGDHWGQTTLENCRDCLSGRLGPKTADSVTRLWPVVFVPPRPDRDPSRELVVAAYREDLAWLASVPYRVTVYQKEGRRVEGVDSVTLPAGKREAGAYLSHIVARYDSLAPLTIFCQGDPFDHAPDFLDRLGLPYDAPTTLTTRYKADQPAAWVKALDRVETHHGFEVRYGDAAIDAQGTGSGWFDHRAWSHVFAVPMPRPLWFGYANTWIVPCQNILARPREFWAWLLDECDSGESGRSRTDPPVNPWSLEATFYCLLSDPAEFPVRWPR